MEEITISKLEYEMLLRTVLILYKKTALLEAENLELKMRVELDAVKE